jgi:tetrahydromethanopterin S-methyltransferase subunit C
MHSSPKHLVGAIGLITIGLALGAAGIYVGETDDAPGAALLGLLLMIGLVVFGVKTARRKPVR